MSRSDVSEHGKDEDCAFTEAEQYTYLLAEPPRAVLPMRKNLCCRRLQKFL